jgi:hypothetical protein
MGKINNYAVTAPSPGDKILASDATTGNTKNITAQSLYDIQTSQKVYRAYISQVSTSAPTTVEVPGNTIAGTWTYVGVGDFLFTSTGTFASGKSGCIISVSNSKDKAFEFIFGGANSVSFKSYLSGLAANGAISNLYIEIFTHSL